jgi:hypothetical protein
VDAGGEDDQFLTAGVAEGQQRNGAAFVTETEGVGFEFGLE